MDYAEALGDALGWDALTRMSVSEDLRFVVSEAEAEIAKRGLQDQYAEAVLDLLFPGGGIYLGYDSIDGAPGGKTAFALLTAPPEQRVRAMLKVLS